MTIMLMSSFFYVNFVLYNIKRFYWVKNEKTPIFFIVINDHFCKQNNSRNIIKIIKKIKKIACINVNNML